MLRDVRDGERLSCWRILGNHEAYLNERVDVNRNADAGPGDTSCYARDQYLAMSEKRVHVDSTRLRQLVHFLGRRSCDRVQVC